MAAAAQEGANVDPRGAPEAPSTAWFAAAHRPRILPSSLITVGGMMKTRLLFFHRWISLFAAIFWLLQAASGIAISFRSELDDAFLGRSAVALDTAKLGVGIEALQAQGAQVSSVWASGGRHGQFDAYVTRTGGDYTVRIDGMGRIHRDRSDSELVSNGALFETLTLFHQTLLLGNTGTVIIGISGVLLILNIAIGITIAWRRRGILKLMTRRPTGSSIALLLGWHRLIGLWFAAPALVLVCAGVALAFEGQVERLVSGEMPAPSNAPEQLQVRTRPGEAIATALKQFPGAELTALVMPADETPWYRVRVLAPNELPRKYGNSTVYISPFDGRVLLRHDARRSAAGRKLVETLYPLHTGQIGGLPGRLLSLAFGFALVTLVVLGVLLWRERRALRVNRRRYDIREDRPGGSSQTGIEFR
jgi:uncharacterized iron-regulated membrane protein